MCDFMSGSLAFTDNRATHPAERVCGTITADLGYNNTGYNDNLLVAILCHRIDCFLREIAITSLFRNFVRNRYNESSVARRNQHSYE